MDRPFSDRDLLEAVLGNIDEGVYVVDRQRRIQHWSKGAERISGYRQEEVMGRSCGGGVLVHVDEFGTEQCQCGCPLMRSVALGCRQEGTLFLQHKEGHRVPVSVSASPLRDAAGQVVGAVEIFRDSTAMITALDRIRELQKQALVDPLTGTGNRRHTEITLRARLDELQRHGWPFGLLFLDVDHFKAVNDEHGHVAGDRVLTMVARTLLANVRSFDFVGRWGGEEFVAVVVNVDWERLESTAERFRVLVERSRLKLDNGAELGVTVSVGGTLATLEDSLETLLNRADGLLYQSKAAGRNRVTLAVGQGEQGSRLDGEGGREADAPNGDLRLRHASG